MKALRNAHDNRLPLITPAGTLRFAIGLFWMKNILKASMAIFSRELTICNLKAFLLLGMAIVFMLLLTPAVLP